ncbi:unnamed protein product [Symbiodinium natans]|uniref:Uncharacterized protein n=1 Tax=Symbiodinium natans TaxID=878477 RepID=A0A812IGE1_9DINO|nr:unnamed protein product [Symbiodinium natans]
MTLLVMALLSFATAKFEEETTAMLQLASPTQLLCSCEQCPSVAEAKSIMINSCKNEPQQLVCTHGVEAAFAGSALDKTFDVKTCQVLEVVFRHLGLLSIPFYPRRRGNIGNSDQSGDGERSEPSKPSEVSEPCPCGVTINGDNNSIRIDNSNTGNTVGGNMGPSDSGNTYNVGSGNLIPSSNELVIIPVGSGNVVITPVGSGNIVITPIGSGNFVSVPSGSATVDIVPTGSGNRTTVVGKKFFVPIGADIILNNTSIESTTEAPSTAAPGP